MKSAPLAPFLIWSWLIGWISVASAQASYGSGPVRSNKVPVPLPFSARNATIFGGTQNADPHSSKIVDQTISKDPVDVVDITPVCQPTTVQVSLNAQMPHKFTFSIQKEPSKRLPVSASTLSKAILLGSKLASEIQETERTRLGTLVTTANTNLAHATIRKASPQAEAIARLSNKMMQATIVLVQGKELNADERLPAELDKENLQQMLQNVDVNHIMSNGASGGLLDCSSCDSAETTSKNCFPIPIPENDPFFLPYNADGTRKCMSFTRTLMGQQAPGYRNQINEVSSYIDGSNIYGTTACNAKKLRLFKKGELRSTENAESVLNEEPVPGAAEQDCQSQPGHLCFKMSQMGSHDHLCFTCMPTIWIREHNRIAKSLSQINTDWLDEKIYQESRKIVIGAIQHITYNEYLPSVLGCDIMAQYNMTLQESGYYTGYDVHGDASISAAFATAAFRFGHSMINSLQNINTDNVPNLDNRPKRQAAPPPPPSTSSYDAPASFTNVNGGVDIMLQKLLSTPSGSPGRLVVDEMRNHMFELVNVEQSGFDLGSINIQRGRDHGLPPYNDFREWCGLPRARQFDDLSETMHSQSVQALRTAYHDVQDIDVYTGIMSELPLIGALLGPTGTCIVAEQFQRLRQYDRFWYENGDQDTGFTLGQLVEIRKITLAKVICQNSPGVIKVQPKVFDMPDKSRNAQVACNQLPEVDLNKWLDKDKPPAVSQTGIVVKAAIVGPDNAAISQTNRVSNGSIFAPGFGPVDITVLPSLAEGSRNLLCRLTQGNQSKVEWLENHTVILASTPTKQVMVSFQPSNVTKSFICRATSVDGQEISIPISIAPFGPVDIVSIEQPEGNKNLGCVLKQGEIELLSIQWLAPNGIVLNASNSVSLFLTVNPSLPTNYTCRAVSKQGLVAEAAVLVPVCSLTPWTCWSNCTAECEGGIKHRTRTTVPANCTGVNPDLDPAVKDEWDKCNTGPCPTNCTVAAWEQWCPCSVTCGNGTTTRRRQILEHPTAGGMDCPILEETKNCSLNVQCPIDCSMTSWGPWCECPCNGKFITRHREILVSNNLIGSDCGATTEAEPCHRKCADECVVSQWMAWTVCSMGMKERTRIIIQRPTMRNICPPTKEMATCW